MKKKIFIEIFISTVVGAGMYIVLATLIVICSDTPSIYIDIVSNNWLVSWGIMSFSFLCFSFNNIIEKRKK